MDFYDTPERRLDPASPRRACASRLPRAAGSLQSHARAPVGHRSKPSATISTNKRESSTHQASVMNRVINLTLDEGIVVIRCLSEKVAISAIERLPQGGVRLVCMSSEGTELIRRKLKRYLIDGDPPRDEQRPLKPLG